MPEKLVVMVGPDRFNMEVARLNDVEHPHEIRSEHFIGRVLVRIVDAPGGHPGEPGYEYFRDRSRRFCIQIEGRFTRPWRGSEIVFGTDLDRLIDFPRRPFNAGMAVAHMIDPCVYYEESPPSRRPYIMSPYCACVNTLCAWPAPARAHDAVVVLQGAGAGAPSESTSHVPSRTTSIDSSRPLVQGGSALSLPGPSVDEGDVVPLEVLDKTAGDAPKKKRGWLSLGGSKDERKTKRYWRFLGFIQDPRVRAYLAAHHTSLDALIQQPSLYAPHPTHSHPSASLGSLHHLQSQSGAQLGLASSKESVTHSVPHLLPSRRRVSDESDSASPSTGRTGPYVSSSGTTGDDANSARLLQQLGLGAHEAGGQTPDPIKMMSLAQNDLYKRLSASLGGTGGGDKTLHEIDEEELDALLMTTAPSTPFQSFEELPRLSNRPPTLQEESQTTPPSSSNSTTPAPAPARGDAAPSQEPTAEAPALDTLVIPEPVPTSSARPSPIVQIEEPDDYEREGKEKSRKRGSKMMRHLSIGGKDKDKDKDKDNNRSEKEISRSRRSKSRSRDRRGLGRSLDLSRGLFDSTLLPSGSAEDHGDELAQILHDRDTAPARKSISLSRSLSTSFGFRSRNSVDAQHAPAGPSLHGLGLSTVESAEPLAPQGGESSAEFGSLSATSKVKPTLETASTGTASVPVASDLPPSREAKDKRASYTGNIFKKMKPRNLRAGEKDGAVTEGGTSSISSEAAQLSIPDEADKPESSLDRLRSKRHSKRHSMQTAPGVAALPGVGHKQGHGHGHGHVHNYGPRCSAKEQPEGERHHHHHPSHAEVREAAGPGGEWHAHPKKSMTDSAARMTSSIAQVVTAPGRMLVDGVSSIPVPSLPRSRGNSPHPHCDDDRGLAAAAAADYVPAQATDTEYERSKPKKRLSLVRPRDRDAKDAKDAKDTKEEIASAEPRRRFSTRLGRPPWSAGNPRRSLSVDPSLAGPTSHQPSTSPPATAQPLSAYLGPPTQPAPLTVSPAPLDEAKNEAKNEVNHGIKNGTKSENIAEAKNEYEVKGVTKNESEHQVPDEAEREVQGKDRLAPVSLKPEANIPSLPSATPATVSATCEHNVATSASDPAAPTPLLVHPKPRQAPLQLGVHLDDEDDLAPSTPASLSGPAWPTGPTSPQGRSQHVATPPASTFAGPDSTATASPPRAPTAPSRPGTAAEIYHTHPWLSGGSELQPVTSGLMRSMAGDDHGDGKEVFRLADRVPRIFSQTPVAEGPAGGVGSGAGNRTASLRRAHSVARSPSAPPLSAPRRDATRNPARSTLTVDEPGSSQVHLGAAARARLKPALPPKPSVAERLVRESAENWRPTLDAELGPWRFTDPTVDMIEDNTFVMLKKSMTVPERRRYFGDMQHQESFIYDPDVVYSTAFFSNMMDFNSFDLAIGIVRMNIRRFFKNMPVRYTLRAKDEEICMATVSFQIVDED